jgi:hypothetical protein
MSAPSGLCCVGCVVVVLWGNAAADDDVVVIVIVLVIVLACVVPAAPVREAPRRAGPEIRRTEKPLAVNNERSL